jgi:2-phospho-L-lactate guanylyltransferase
MGASLPNCAAIIAVKRRSRGKSHLADSLSARQRVELIRAMLDRVVEAAQGAATITQTLVVSPERDTLAARIPLLIDGGAGLNEAFELARGALRDRGVGRMLALPADLPGVRSADLDALVSAAADGVAIAADRRGSGTNGLVCPVDLPLRFHFGLDSRRLHVEEARKLGIEPVIVSRPGLNFDVDLPVDLVGLRDLHGILSAAVSCKPQPLSR